MFKSLVHLSRLNIRPSLLMYYLHSGVGDLTKINIPAGDAGGELDPHGATGNGVFNSARRCVSR
jgi:hypothetical protein